MISGVLTGERVTLRPVRAGDRGGLEALFTEPAVAEWWGDPDAAVRDSLGASEEEAHFIVEVDGEMAGMIQCYEETDEMYRHASIDIALGSRWQGRGIGPDAIRTLARHLVEQRGHHRLTIDPAAHNTRAIKAYEKVGFRAVGVMRQYERGPDGSWHDGLLMEMLAAELRP